MAALAADAPAEDAAVALEQQLAGTAGTATLRAAVQRFGELAMASRAGRSEARMNQALIATGRRLLVEAHRRQALAEESTGRLEADLARFYGSTAWSDLSYAYDWLPCWIGWLQLGSLAESGDARREQIKDARLALKHGLVVVWRPELVAQSSRGLARLALVEHRPDQALRILNALRAGFSARLAAPTLAELDADLAALRNEADAGRPAGTGTPPSTADVDAELKRIHRLLDQQLRLGYGASEAAPLIRRMLDSGTWDQRLLLEALRAPEALADQEVGVIGDLLVAESLLESEHFFSAVEKYTQFFRAVQDAPQRGLARWRYRQGYACLKADLRDCALSVAEDLQAHWTLSAELQAANRKLRFFAWYGRNRELPGQDNARKLSLVAEEVIRADPLDPDADWARLALAATETSAERAGQLLEQIRDSRHLQGNVELVRFRRVVEALLADAGDQNAEALRAAADRARSTLDAIAGAQRSEPWVAMSALLIQMLRTGPDPALQPTIEASLNSPEAERLTWQAGYWALVQIWVARADRTELRAEARRTADAPFDAWRQGVLLGALEDLNDPGLTSAAAASLLSDEETPPGRVRALVALGAAQLRMGNGQSAVETARRALRLDSSAVDARWLYAAGCDAMQLPGEADPAWRDLDAVREAPASARQRLWRLEMAALARRPLEGCSLVRALRRDPVPMPPSYGVRVLRSAKALECPA